MNASTSGKNFPSFLPKVGEGSPISYDHINMLSEAVMRTQIRGSQGSIMKSTTGGISFESLVSDEQSKPWTVILNGDYLQVLLGNAWGGVSARQEKSLDIEKFVSPYPQEGVAEDKKIKIPCAKAAYVDYVENPVAGRENWFYTDKAPYTLSFPVGNLDEDMVVAVVEGGDVIYQKASSFQTNLYAIPIAYVTKDKYVIQITTGDIYFRTNPNKLQAYLYSENDEYRAKITAGTVNNQLPKYENQQGEFDPNAYLKYTPTKYVYFYLELVGEPKPADPFPTELNFISSPQPKEDTKDKGYILVALAYYDMGETPPKLKYFENYLTNSLRAESHIFSPSTHNRYYYSL